MTSQTPRISKKARSTAAAAANQARYAKRTGMDKRASLTLAAAISFKVPTFEDDAGNIVRIWQTDESYTHSDIAAVLSNRLAVEPNEMLGTIPPRAIKYSTTKGWIVPNASGSLYTVTERGASELKLSRRFKGGTLHGRKIPFAK